MSYRNLEEKLRATGDIVGMLRNAQTPPYSLSRGAAGVIRTGGTSSRRGRRAACSSTRAIT